MDLCIQVSSIKVFDVTNEVAVLCNDVSCVGECCVDLLLPLVLILCM